VLHVCVVQHLSDTSNLEHTLRRCSELGWRVPSLEKLGQACRLDWHLVLLNHKLKTIFDRSIASDDGTLDKKSIENQVKESVRVYTDEVMLFQAEIATIPDVTSEMLRADGTEQVCGSANRAMAIIRRIRTQQVKLAIHGVSNNFGFVSEPRWEGSLFHHRTCNDIAVSQIACNICVILKYGKP
jgi:hypothetical protein